MGTPDAYGTLALPFVKDAMAAKSLPVEARCRLARLSAKVSGTEAGATLLRSLETQEKVVRHEALSALGSRGYRAEAEETRAIIESHIEEEAGDASWKLATWRDLANEERYRSLRVSLENELREGRERLFLLLSFLYDGTSIQTARENMDHESPEKRGYAAEMLDVTLSLELRDLALPLLEKLEPPERLARLEDRFPQKVRTPPQRLLEILNRSDQLLGNWTKACAIRAAVGLSENGLRARLTELGATDDELLSETARWALGAVPAPEERDESCKESCMLTLEKVLLLKGVAMFATTSEEVLVNVASILEELSLGADQLVFDKGAVGDSMYVIASGRVRVFDGDKTINYLGEREIFGELALLDPEPRSASVETVEDTILFRLDRDTFFELMSDNIGVVGGVMQVLCRRLRRMTAMAMGEAGAVPTPPSGTRP